MTVDWHENCWNFCHLEATHTHEWKKNIIKLFVFPQQHFFLRKETHKVVPCELAFFANFSCGIAAFTATDNITKHKMLSKIFLFIVNFLFTCTHAVGITKLFNLSRQIVSHKNEYLIFMLLPSAFFASTKGIFHELPLIHWLPPPFTLINHSLYLINCLSSNNYLLYILFFFFYFWHVPIQERQKTKKKIFCC